MVWQVLLFNCMMTSPSRQALLTSGTGFCLSIGEPNYSLCGISGCNKTNVSHWVCFYRALEVLSLHLETFDFSYFHLPIQWKQSFIGDLCNYGPSSFWDLEEVAGFVLMLAHRASHSLYEIIKLKTNCLELNVEGLLWYSSLVFGTVWKNSLKQRGQACASGLELSNVASGRDKAPHVPALCLPPPACNIHLQMERNGEEAERSLHSSSVAGLPSWDDSGNYTE